jgi:hypothetical protein
MPNLRIIGGKEFADAMQRRLNRDQRARMSSAIASIGKKEDSLRDHNWVTIAPLEGGPPHTQKVTIIDADDACWSAIVAVDGDNAALIGLFVGPGTELSEDDRQVVESAYNRITAVLKNTHPTPWRG